MLLPRSLGRVRALARAEVLGEWLTQRLRKQVTVTVADTYADVATAIIGGDVDLAWAPPSICAQVLDHALAIFKAVRDGHSSYYSAIVARADGPATVEDLAGKRAAWVDEQSVGGYLLARAHLRRAGIEPEHAAFYGAYGEALRAVVAGRADFAATFSATPEDSQTKMRLHELIGPGSDQLEIVGYTGAAPADGLVITHRADQRLPGIVDRLRPLVDGSGGYTFLLSLLEAERLEPARPGDYASLLQ